MTDVDCLYDKNPRTHHDAKAVEVVEDISTITADIASAGSSLGTGGMSTKIVAARLATSAGVTTVITRSSNPGNIVNIIKYVQATKQPQPDSPATSPTLRDETPSHSISSLHTDGLTKLPLHTRFLPDPHPIRDRSFWLLHGLAPHGTIYIDEGAHRALAEKAGLLPVGVVGVTGSFSQQEAVRIVVVDRQSYLAASSNPTLPNGSAAHADSGSKAAPIEVGRALVNYSATEISRIKGLRSIEIHQVLGYADSEYVALRENVSLLKSQKPSRPVTPSPANGA